MSEVSGHPAGPVRQIVLQATGFCNIDCRYCYLPDRLTRTVMPLDVVSAAARALASSGMLDDEVEIRWHAGEPLTAPRDFYARAHEILRRTLAGITVPRFSLQTNGLLIDDAWCSFFRREDVRVGVSLDGPAHVHDAYRRTRNDRGTLSRAMRGVERLRAAGLDCDVISVITPVTLLHQEAYLDFMARLRPRSLGLNPEETEGGNSSTLHRSSGFEPRYRAFLRSVAAWSARTGVAVRELERMREHVLSHRLPVRNTQNEPLSIVTVGTDGGVSSFSPELFGWRSPDHGDFVLGDLRDPGFRLDAWRPGFARLADEVAQGRRDCARSCGYFALCGGGAPANKWAEHQAFTGTRTRFCALGVMAVADVVLDELEGARR
ncbi:cyclophane-forming radical SAM/SPASM peptide maturase GrrM/OscB [Streptomyces specialis]|uniref:cyclophane-forming radical SAM/SPASM peptide maturase GrrM/OscB n=1 Tax=Streptomyces specialis TaxID=498367 RepID=UPI00073F1968|nr:cyclophane-forming radical SAM/SPASM peptide maturase GrrM/OscB [Streptomyces specialis]